LGQGVDKSLFKSSINERIGCLFRQFNHQRETELIFIKKRTTQPVNQVQFEQLCSPYSRICLDLGTGDGKFPYNEAKKDPKTLFLGVDICPQAMCEISIKAAKKPARGGVSNVGLIYSTVEDLPQFLVNVADKITINYPWSSLLRDLISPKKTILQRIGQLGKNQSTIELSINYSIFQEKAYLAKLNLPKVDLNYIKKNLVPAYKECSMQLIENKIFKKVELNRNTTWGKHLSIAANRETLFLKFIVNKST